MFPPVGPAEIGDPFMNVSLPRALVEKRLDALRLTLPTALAGSVEGIHQARVASRRLREVLPILPPSEGHFVARILRRDVRLITRALGPVRELDVSLILLSELESSRPLRPAAIRSVRRALERQRAASFAEMLSVVELISLDRLSEASVAMADAAAGRVALRRCRMMLARRLTGRTSLLASAIEAAGLLYAADRIHAVRIAVKKLRYAVEIAQELRGASVVTVLGRLKTAQELLGSLHDFQVLARRVRDTTPGTHRRHGQFEDLAAALDHRIRLLHGEFLLVRPRLAIVFERSRQIRAQVEPPSQRGGRQRLPAVERRTLSGA
jgi:CHAD domain-containing protein